MKAMIFAAGLGTRLKPLTDTLPKALVPVCGKPLIEHVCRKLHAAGIDGAVVNVHHFADKVEEWLDGQGWICTESSCLSEGKMPVQVSDERKMLLETGGAVLHARKYLEGCGSFLIHNVDILSDLDLEWFASQVRPDALATLLVSSRKSSRQLLFDPETMALVGWHNLQTGQGNASLCTELRYRNPETGKHDGKFISVDFAAIARAYGCVGYTIRTQEELEKALIESKEIKDQPVLFDIKVLPKSMTEGYGSWWRVGSVEVGGTEANRAAWQNHLDHVKDAKQY